MKDYLGRLKNPFVCFAVCMLILNMVVQLGIDVDMNSAELFIQSFCNVCVLLGIMNNSTTSGVDLPFGKIEKK